MDLLDDEVARPVGSRLIARILRSFEALFDRVYSSRWNPLYRSGALAIAFLAATVVTGIYLFLLYRVAEPYESVAELDATWVGSLMRSVHRYAADAALVCVGVHILKMLATARTWGPRAFAWVSGVILLAVLLLCGWTGLVMAWDLQGQLIAVEGAHLLDLLPVLSEPTSRVFIGAEPVGRAFFFMNLFLHVALPLGLVALFWLHTSRIARPPILPPKTIGYWAVGSVVLLAIAVPVPLPPRADLLSVPVAVPLDLFYAFWIPLAIELGPGAHALAWIVLAAIALSVPWWWRPGGRKGGPSRVDVEKCVACGQCYLDCPYEAIQMVPRLRPSRLSEMVAGVDPQRCVSCGICAGSCAPMGVGPPRRSGRDQLARVEELVAFRPLEQEVVVLACRDSVGTEVVVPGARIVTTGCCGSVHTSVIELLLRHGAGGVFVATCPPRDCINREGPTWLDERLYNDREAELQARVDRRLVATGGFGPGEARLASKAVADFVASIAAVSDAVPLAGDIELECSLVESAEV